MQCLADHRMVVADAEHPEAGQEVRVPHAVRVVEVAAFRALVYLVESDRVEHAGPLRIEVPGVQFLSLAASLREEGRQVESHSPIVADRACSYPCPSSRSQRTSGRTARE